MWDQVIASVWGTTMDCKGEWNFRNDGRGGVNQKHWEVSERWKRVILSQYGETCGEIYGVFNMVKFTMYTLLSEEHIFRLQPGALEGLGP
jgi:hypothetical protein